MTGLKGDSYGLPKTDNVEYLLIFWIISNFTSVSHEVIYKRLLDNTASCCQLSLEESLKLSGKKFVWSSKYGFLTSSPNNIGTGLEVRVRVRLPKVIKVRAFPGTVRQLRQFKLSRLARKFDLPHLVFNLLAHRMSLMRKH